MINELIEDYLHSNCEEENDLLKKIERETWQKVLSPHMVSGKYQGRFLSMISKILNPKYILEIGTFTGYSTLCLCEGLQENGKLITIDNNLELIETFTKKKINESHYHKNIDFIIGEALDIIPTLDYDFDIVFIDADKKNYIEYFNLIINKVRKGGIILSDNVLWRGKVVENVKEKNINITSIMKYNKFLKEDKRIENIIIPIRDGISISLKK